jgi:uncharacterized membrane protein HdeD (DUF308 family)
MELALVRNWWSVALRGLLGVILGMVALGWPAITFASLVMLFGAYALIDGIVNLYGAVRAARAHERWGVLVFEGIVGIAAAAVTVMWPAITALALVVLIGVWALVTGAMEIAAAIRLRKYISDEWLLLLSGIASLAFGLLIVTHPLAGALVIAIWFGAYMLIFGALLIALGFRLRGLRDHHLAGPGIPAPVH